jgi:5-(carboxyamino)imidazole ribonucleotide synthase
MIIGVLGGGQLGRMLALAGYPFGHYFRFLDPSPTAPAGDMATHVFAPFDSDNDTLERFASGLDLVTYEFENVPVATARFLAERVAVYPPVKALEVAQDRLMEKSFFRELGIPTPEFEPVETRDDLERAVERIGLPAVLKTRRLGYDGKGQYVLRERHDVGRAWELFPNGDLILESYIPFTRELSILAVRGRDGEAAFYPLVENHHRDGILRLSLAPAPGLTAELQAEAEGYAGKVIDALEYVGVLAIELFEAEGRLLASEMAPRVHNSGHWTIEGAETSQFENHIRAVTGMPLGATNAVGQSAMLNIIGVLPDAAKVLAIPGAHLHLYNKRPRAGRKLGHVTLRADDAGVLEERLEMLRSITP